MGHDPAAGYAGHVLLPVQREQPQGAHGVASAASARRSHAACAAAAFMVVTWSPPRRTARRSSRLTVTPAVAASAAPDGTQPSAPDWIGAAVGSGGSVTAPVDGPPADGA